MQESLREVRHVCHFHAFSLVNVNIELILVVRCSLWLDDWDVFRVWEYVDLSILLIHGISDASELMWHVEVQHWMKQFLLLEDLSEFVVFIHFGKLLCI